MRGQPTEFGFADFVGAVLIAEHEHAEQSSLTFKSGRLYRTNRKDVSTHSTGIDVLLIGLIIISFSRKEFSNAALCG